MARRARCNAAVLTAAAAEPPRAVAQQGEAHRFSGKSIGLPLRSMWAAAESDSRHRWRGARAATPPFSRRRLPSPLAPWRNRGRLTRFSGKSIELPLRSMRVAAESEQGTALHLEDRRFCNSFGVARHW